MTLLRLDQEDELRLVGFDRVQKHNALDQAMVDELSAVLDDARDSPGVLIFYSTTPGIFVAGADIAQLRQRTAADASRRINAGLFDRIAAHRWPTIAVVDGPALGGGCELALACDFRIASSRATFGQPELRLGILAGAGGNFRLERVAGLSIARRMLLAGETIGADEALAAGLVDRVGEPEQVLDDARALAGRIAGASWQALELTKVALAMAAPPSTSDFDAAAQAVLFESEEKARRMDAFLQRRNQRT